MRTYIICLPVGSIGKTTITDHVIAAYAPSPAILSIESASPSGSEVELLSQDEGRGARVLRSRLFAARSDRTTIVDSGVTDATVVAEVLRELARLKQLPAELTVVLPFDGSRKAASGLSKFAPSLPAGVRKVLVYNSVRGGESEWQEQRESDSGRKVADFAAAAGIEVCPTPIYYSALLDTESPFHDLLKDAGSIEAVAALDLEQLREQARDAEGDHDAEDRLGLALTGIDMAQSASANLRAVYECLAGG